MNTIKKLGFAAIVAAFSAFNANAQLSLGDDCGCPPLASRSVVKLTTIATNSVAGGTGSAFNTGATQLTCDNVYIIDDKIYVPNGGQVYIEPGTVLKGTADGGSTNTPADADAFIVSRGGQLFANGTECCPIIFTTVGLGTTSAQAYTNPLQGDPLDGTFPLNTRSGWGGLIMLGTATNNVLAADGDGLTIQDGVVGIEGLDPAFPENQYGAGDAGFPSFDDNDNSGVLRYVSIRHGGIAISPNNEINGLTLGSVGRGTTLEHIEIVGNADDGIEFFGGTVDLKWASVMFVGDDGYDWDQGYIGRGQYWYSVENASDKGWECDGDDDGTDKIAAGLYYSNPTVYNTTMIGEGGTGDNALSLKSETQGTIANSIFTAHEDGIDFNDDGGATGQGSIPFYLSGDLVIKNNIFEGMTNPVNGTNGGLITAADLMADGNMFLAAGTNVVDYTHDLNTATNAVSDLYNPVPAEGTAGITTTDLAPNDGWFDRVNFKGAFKPGAEPWTAGYSVGELIGADQAIVGCPTDINKDGITDVSDLQLIIGAWLETCP